MDNVFLIHGEDDFRAQEKLNFYKNGFIKKYGDLNISTYTTENMDTDKIMNDTISSPFLSEKKMIVMENLFGASKKDGRKILLDLIKKAPSTSVVIVFEDRSLNDKKQKNKDVEELLKLTGTKNNFESKKLYENEIPAYIQQKIKIGGYTMDFRAINTLVSLVGANTRQIDQELMKLMAYKHQSKEINTEDVLKLVKAEVNKGVFDLTDSLAKKDMSDAQEIIRHLFETGENPVSVLAMITFHFRNLLLLKVAEKDRVREAEVLKEAGMHPYVYKKTSQQSRGFTLEKLREIYHFVFETDLAIKTGEKEPELALDLLIIKICM